MEHTKIQVSTAKTRDTDATWSLLNMLPFTCVPGKVIEENKTIMKEQHYVYKSKLYDLHQQIIYMQNSVQLFGGETIHHYNEDMKKYCTLPTDLVPTCKTTTTTMTSISSSPPLLLSSISSSSSSHPSLNETNLTKENIEKKDICKENKLIVQVVNDNCVDVSCKLANDTGCTPLMMNLAQRRAIEVCGKYYVPYLGSQEEYIERRSAVYRLGLDPFINPHFMKLLKERAASNSQENAKQSIPTHHIPEFGAVVHFGVPIIRDKAFQFLESPFVLNIVAVGAVDLRNHWEWFRENERLKYAKGNGDSNRHYNLPENDNTQSCNNAKCEGDFDSQMNELDKKIDWERFKEDTRKKIRISLCAAVATKQEYLVLGALGCGAFLNPPHMIAQLFEDVLCERRFIGKFKRVVFAVMGEPNYSIFKKQFSKYETTQ